MTPTPEQIKMVMDCARQIVQSYGPTTLSQADRDNLCRAMDHYELTAAAGMRDKEPWPDYHGPIGNTAAAGVGEFLPSVNFDKEGKPYTYCPECGRQDNLLDDRTVERCAQVAEEHLYFCEGCDDTHRDIAAAIMALKDKP